MEKQLEINRAWMEKEKESCLERYQHLKNYKECEPIIHKYLEDLAHSGLTISLLQPQWENLKSIISTGDRKKISQLAEHFLDRNQSICNLTRRNWIVIQDLSNSLYQLSQTPGKLGYSSLLKDKIEVLAGRFSTETVDYRAEEIKDTIQNYQTTWRDIVFHVVFVLMLLQLIGILMGDIGYVSIPYLREINSLLPMCIQYLYSLKVAYCDFGINTFDLYLDEFRQQVSGFENDIAYHYNSSNISDIFDCQNYYQDTYSNSRFQTILSDSDLSFLGKTCRFKSDQELELLYTGLNHSVSNDLVVREPSSGFLTSITYQLSDFIGNRKATSTQAEWITHNTLQLLDKNKLFTHNGEIRPREIFMGFIGARGLNQDVLSILPKSSIFSPGLTTIQEISREYNIHLTKNKPISYFNSFPKIIMTALASLTDNLFHGGEKFVSGCIGFLLAYYLLAYISSIYRFFKKYIRRQQLVNQCLRQIDYIKSKYHRHFTDSFQSKIRKFIPNSIVYWKEIDDKNKICIQAGLNIWGLDKLQDIICAGATQIDDMLEYVYHETKQELDQIPDKEIEYYISRLQFKSICLENRIDIPDSMMDDLFRLVEHQANKIPGTIQRQGSNILKTFMSGA